MVPVCGFNFGRYTDRYYLQQARLSTAKNQNSLGVFLRVQIFSLNGDGAAPGTWYKIMCWDPFGRRCCCGCEHQDDDMVNLRRGCIMS